MTPPPTVSCQVDPSSCTWTYTADRAAFVEAAWRLHYAAHARGAAALEDYRRTGTTHPVHRPPSTRTRRTRYSDNADTT